MRAKIWLKLAHRLFVPTCCTVWCYLRSTLFWVFYAAHVGNSLPTFRDKLSVPFLKMAPICFPEKSVRN